MLGAFVADLTARIPVFLACFNLRMRRTTDLQPTFVKSIDDTAIWKANVPLGSQAAVVFHPPFADAHLRISADNKRWIDPGLIRLFTLEPIPYNYIDYKDFKVETLRIPLLKALHACKAYSARISKLDRILGGTPKVAPARMHLPEPHIEGLMCRSWKVGSVALPIETIWEEKCPIQNPRTG